MNKQRGTIFNVPLMAFIQTIIYQMYIQLNCYVQGDQPVWRKIGEVWVPQHQVYEEASRLVLGFYLFVFKNCILLTKNIPKDVRSKKGREGGGGCSDNV